MSQIWQYCTIIAEQIAPEERILVERINCHQVLDVDVLAEGLLTTTLVGNQRLQHRSHHVQL